MVWFILCSRDCSHKVIGPDPLAVMPNTQKYGSIKSPQGGGGQAHRGPDA